MAISKSKYVAKGLLQLLAGLLLAGTAVGLSLVHTVSSDTTMQVLVVVGCGIGGWLIASGLYYVIPFRYGSPWNAEMRFRGTAFEYACGLSITVFLVIVTYNLPLIERISQPVVSSQVTSAVKTVEGRSDTRDRYTITYTYHVGGQAYSLTNTNRSLPTKTQNIAYNPTNPSDGAVIGVAPTVSASVRNSFIFCVVFIIAFFSFFYFMGRFGSSREHGPIRQKPVRKT